MVAATSSLRAGVLEPRCRPHKAAARHLTTASACATTTVVAPSIRNATSIQLKDDCIVTTAELRPKQTALEIPASEWLTVATVAASPLGAAVAGLEPWLQLALYLIHTDSVPPSADALPLLWDEQAQGMLAGSQLAASMQGYASFFAAKHAELAAGVYAQHPSLFPAATFTQAALMRAACAVRASSHPPLEGDRIAIVPGLHLAHSRRQAGTLSVKAGGLFGGAEKLVWEAGEVGLPAGEALALDLSRGGSRVDSQMVLDYGARVFESKGAARDANPGYVLTLAIPESDAFADDKLDILDLNKQTGTYTLTPSDPPPADCLAFLRLLNLSGADAFLLEALFRNEVWDHLQDPISEDNERAVCEGLAAGCREALAGYVSSIDEDLAALRIGVDSAVERAALLVRLGEKEAIDGALQWSEGRLEQLGRLEYYAERRLKRLGLLDDSGRTTYDSFFEDGIA